MYCELFDYSVIFLQIWEDIYVLWDVWLQKTWKMSKTREQAGPSKSSGSAEEKEKDDRMFECNICLDTAKDAVVSMCGHLFW